MTGELSNNSIDFSKINGVNEVPVISENHSSDIMRSANEEAAKITEIDSVSVDDLHIAQNLSVKDEHVELWNLNGKNKKKVGFKVNYWKLLVFSFVFFLIFGVIALVLNFYLKYINIALEQIIKPPYDEVVKTVNKYEQIVNDYLDINDYFSYQWLSLINEDWQKNLNKIVQADRVNYLHKKMILQEDLELLTADIFKLHQRLLANKQNITKYGYMTESIYDLLHEDNQINSIETSLLSLEVIKFSSAIKVFSYLDVFMKSFSAAIGFDVETVYAKMEQFAERWERDIDLYLRTCYLNPFELDYDCDIIWDFDNYYALYGVDQNMDRKFFKKVLQYIDLRLEQTEIPSFNIIFKKFDPSKKDITFVIDINTFKQDERALVEKWIINPHIFVVTQLLNLLRQSRVLVGESIDIKNLEVKDKSIQIGDSVFDIRHSQLLFTLPIQKTEQREIFDFIDVK